MADEDRRIADAVDREQPRLRSFIRRRVADSEDAEDILQDVFYELVEMAEERDTPDGPQLGVWSNGVWFPVGPARSHLV